MFTQTSTRTLAQSLRKRVLGSDLVDLLTGPHGVDRYTELVAPTWTLGEARAKVVDVRRTTPRSVTLTLAPNADLHVRPRRQGRSVRQPHGRHRRPPAHPLLLTGQRRRRPQPRADDRSPRRRAGLERTCTSVPVAAWWSAWPVSAATSCCPTQRPRRILFVSGGSGITPVMAMLRTLVAEGHRGRDRVRPLRAHARRGVLPRRAGRKSARRAGAARLHPIGRRRPRRPLRTGASGRRHAGRPTRCSSAGQRLWSRPSGSTARTCTPRASCRRSSSRRRIRRAAE